MMLEVKYYSSRESVYFCSSKNSLQLILEYYYSMRHLRPWAVLVGYRSIFCTCRTLLYISWPDDVHASSLHSLKYISFPTSINVFTIRSRRLVLHNMTGGPVGDGSKSFQGIFKQSGNCQLCDDVFEEWPWKPSLATRKIEFGRREPQLEAAELETYPCVGRVTLHAGSLHFTSPFLYGSLARKSIW